MTGFAVREKDVLMNPTYHVKKSKRKTVSLSVTRELEVLIRAPLKMTDTEIEKLIVKHKTWIEKHLLKQKELNENTIFLTVSDVAIKELKEKAKEIITNRVQYYSKVIGVTPTGIKITSATTRWGSCSGKNSLCFPYRIALLPMELIDYIVVHELVHIRVKNHSKKFYREVEKYMPDYKARITGIKSTQTKLRIG